MNGIPSHIDPDLIRQYADGELDAARSAELERDVSAEALASAVAFEQSLRGAVQRSIFDSTPKAPAALKQQIVQAIAAASDEPMQTQPIGKIEPAVVETTRPRFSRVNFFAVAASLVLVAGAVLFGIYGPPIDQLGHDTGVSAAAEISEFASHEHDRCAMDPDRRERKISYSELNACRKSMSGDLGLDDNEIVVFDLDLEGYTLIGGGRCMLPEYEVSGHLMYRRDEPGSLPAMASLFVGTPGSDRLTPGQWMELPVTADCTHKVLASTDGTVDYLLVCCDETDMAKLQAAVGKQLLQHCPPRQSDSPPVP